MATTCPGKPGALLFGNRVAPYHPLGPVEPALHTILAADFALGVTEDPNELVRGLGAVKLVIGYADVWDRALGDDAADALVAFVERGGGLLVLHNGICWAKHPRVRQLVGAAFTGHPEQETMLYRFAGTQPIAAGLDGFAMQEEPYRYEFEHGVEAGAFLHYEQAGRRWAAGWALMRGAGRVVNLQPGHTVVAFENVGYAALVRRAACWCAGGE
ncbi:MAG: ThuA domain-containing protein [Opitutaceae bacterium]